LLLETGVFTAEDRSVQWNKVALIGVGLLGGSIGLALREKRQAGTVVGFVRRAASIIESEKAGAVDRATRNLRQAIAGADLVIFCTPISRMRGLAEAMVPLLQRNAVVTDVGSVKGSVVREVEGMIEQAGAHFVGSHPMAGSEKTGVSAARANLFQDAVCVVTPTARSSKSALRRVETFWESLGSTVLRLAPDFHDQLVSRSSHLPHLIAAVLAHSVLAPDQPAEQRRLCANGFRDTTRIASGSPEMWRDIALANRKNLSGAIDLFVNRIKSLQKLLKAGDEKGVSKFFEQAKRRRDQWRKTQISSSPE
jgi:prephenate dehydrogenase